MKSLFRRKASNDQPAVSKTDSGSMSVSSSTPVTRSTAEPVSQNVANNKVNGNNATKKEKKGFLKRIVGTDGGNSSSVASTVSETNTPTSVFRVTVPEGVQPGQEFQVYAGSRIVRVRLPPGTEPGQSLQITVPVDPSTASSNNPSTVKNGDSLIGDDSILPPDSENVTPVENGAYMVTIPDGVRGGQMFPVTIRGQQLIVTAPTNIRPGTQVRIVPPPQPNTSAPTSLIEDSPSFASTSTNMPKPPEQRLEKAKDEEATQLFEVEVPQGVEPGKPFALLAGGARVLVTCPVNAGPGQRIRFKLPLALAKQRAKPTNEAAAIKLSYDKDGWTRTIRVSDMKFQWVRMNDKGDVDNALMRRSRFDPEKSAFVRKLDFRNPADDRLRDGVLSLIPASEAFVDSRVKGSNGEVLVSYSDIADAQVKSFEEKASWFQEKCALLAVEWNEGHMRINIRREYLLEDSVDAVMSLTRKDLKKLWRFEFINEAGIDAGGLAREWFQLVTTEIFDPDMGLWQSSETNQMMMVINPASKFLHEDYLVYYRFLGRVMGKALFDRQLVAGHMVHFIYKHMLGWPITFKDLESIDEEYYNNLRQLQQMVANGDDLSMLCIDFSMPEEFYGAKVQVDLVPDGSNIELDNTNFYEYLEACLKYRMVERVKAQLSELLLGFFDIIPEPLLTVFDFQELELLMCGLPVIDMEDWKEQTEYSGDYENATATQQFYELPDPCQWFWEVVEEFDQEMKARLLQFVTGTSGVPSRGFGVLQGNDGNVRKFTIHGVSIDVCLYPRAHTCFNRIDLPKYSSKDDLRDKLKLAVTMVATGFDIE